ncbi:MAG: exosortase A [Erythrobacter sp.]|nr:exosortase A [Erythrobacter sp.]MDJ0977848.1 exosortase A [Erythrobacter sp.]
MASLVAATAALVLLCAREWGEMLHQWWDIDTYNHILLVPAVIGWLVWMKREQLTKMTPRASAFGLAVVVAALLVWLVGRTTSINLLAHAGAVGAIQGAIVTILGFRVSAVLALPLGYMAFLVPFGDEIVPFLQAITADIAIAITHWSGVSARIDGVSIDTPAGLFIVAEECSGVRFLIATVALAVLIAFTRFESRNRRAALMAAAVIVPILANGVRAWGTIYIAQFVGVEFAAGFDHIVYGWFFFAFVVAAMLVGAWPFVEREPQDYGYTSAEALQLRWLNRFDPAKAHPVRELAALAALALAASGFGAFAALAALA